MASNMDFTDKAQATLAAAIQLAKDYANAQGEYNPYLIHSFVESSQYLSGTRAPCIRFIE